jgi:uncharacterized protein YeaO (DUF488 family)
MNLNIYRYGQPNQGPGLHVGVTRYLPRGVRREDYARLGYFDVWIPLLAPNRELLAAYLKGSVSHTKFVSQYRSEMREPAARQLIRLLAATASRQPVHLGCFCADPARCHRSLLRDLVIAAAADLPKRSPKAGEFFSPACAMPEI